MNAEKRCTKCEEWKELTEFGIEKRVKDGRRAYCKSCWRVYKKGNQPLFTAYQSKRRANANRLWLAPEQFKAVASIYQAASDLRDKGVNVVVDHIDPVNGKLVCGFTHPDNLVILTVEANAAKSNKFRPYRVEYHFDGTSTTTIF